MSSFFYKGLIGILLGMGLNQCSTTYYQYTQDKKIPYFIHNGMGKVETNLSPLYYDLDKNDKIKLSFSFSENIGRAENLKLMQVKLFTQEKNTSEFAKELNLSKSILEVEYWNGKEIVKISKEKYSGEFFQLIDPSMKEVQYRQTKIIHFRLQNEYTTDDLPETLLQKIIIQWTDKPEEIFSNTLTKTKRTKSFLSGRPFG